MSKALKQKKKLLKHLAEEVYCRLGASPTHGVGVFAIRKGPWKWIEGEPVDEIKPGARKAHADEYHAQLYNTAEDPAETKDLSAEHPEIVKELKALLEASKAGGRTVAAKSGS